LKQQTRRGLLSLLAFGSGAAWSGFAVAQACFELSKLPPADASLRRSLNFKIAAPDTKRACGGCAFFSAGQPASCGTCTILSGGPVSTSSVCDSWAAKS